MSLLLGATSVRAEEQYTITKATDFWGLASMAEDTIHPIHTQIDVLYYDSDWNVLWARWDDVGCYLSPGTKPLPIKTGQRIELDGFTIPGKQEILWDRTTIRVVEEKTALQPIALPENLQQPMDFNLKYVSVTGLVTAQHELDGSHTRLVVVSPDCSITAQVRVRPDSPLPQFQDAFVRIQGVFSVKQNVSHNTSDIEMWVSDIRNIEVVSWLATDPRFETPLAQSETFDQRPVNELVRVAGIVHTAAPGEWILRDAGGLVRVLTHQTNVPLKGERIEAVGYPAVEGVDSVLLRAVARPAKNGANSGAPTLVSKLRLSDQVRQLEPEEASHGFPVDVRGVVTWIDPANHSFFIFDSGGGVEAFLPPDGSIAMPVFGEDVIVRGQTRAGSFVPVVQAASVSLGMSRTLPAPAPLTLDRARTGTAYGEWSEMHGYVHSVQPGDDGVTRFALTTPGGDMAVAVRGNIVESDFSGALVELNGVCDVSVNSRRQLTGVRFLVPSTGLIKVEEPAPADPFETSKRSIGSLLQFTAARDMNHRVQVSGVVTLHRPGSFLYIEDADDRVLVLSRQTDVLQPGERVDVVGIPGIEAGRLVMRDAVYRSIAMGPAPAPVAIEDVETPRLDWDGQTVTLRGRLLDRFDSAEGTRLRLQTGKTFFEAAAPGFGEKRFVPGSILQITGVYRVQFDEYRRPRGFSIDLRAPGDVRLLTQPPWWSSTRLLWASGALLAAVLTTAGWALVMARKNRQLREADRKLQSANAELEHRVAHRTRDLRLEVSQRQASEAALASERRFLREIIDNLPVYLYVKNTSGRFVIVNLPLARMLGATSDADCIGKSDFDFIPHTVAQQYERDDLHVLATGEPVVQREEPGESDGKPGWFSTTKVPLRDPNGRIIGLIGISQDITARKMAEAERTELQRRLVESSRQAGMAEVATGVLHNVGNVLNSVNVSAGLLGESLRASETRTLARVAALLREHEADLIEFLGSHPKGRLLPGMIVQLSEHLNRENASMLTEQELLAKNVEHIKGIVSMQQGYAKVSGLMEPVRVEELVRDAIHIHSTGLDRHEIKIDVEAETLPPIMIDKHKVMQILVNLVSNAKHAVQEVRNGDGRIGVKIGRSEGDRMSISVRDNGVGIPPENLTSIFSHGFTTRAKGHGFGLHSGSLAAREMGGALHVASEGRGHGATFTLELPFVTPTVKR